MDKMLLQKVCELENQGQRVALITIVNTKGSTPRKIGTAMIVERNGKTWGTVGGGCCEAEVRQRALLAMDEELSCMYQAALLNDVAGNEGMVCGGIMDFFIQVI